MNRAIEVPDPYQNETAQDYRNRFLEELQTARAAIKRECDKERRKHMEHLTKLYNQERYAIQKEFNLTMEHLRHHVGNLRTVQEGLQKNIEILTEKKNKIAGSSNAASERGSGFAGAKSPFS